MTRNYDPQQGKWTLTHRVKREIKHHGGEMPVKTLLNQMRRHGYLKEPLRRQLGLLDVDVVDGMARLR